MSVSEIGSRIHEEGIYRINGSKSEVQELKKRFLTGSTDMQHLKSITDTNTICSSIKDFFRNMISEPILTHRLMPKFITAFTNADKTQMKELMYEVSSEKKSTKESPILLVNFAKKLFPN